MLPLKSRQPARTHEEKGVGSRLVTNIKCLCRKDHLLKTFWGWRDQQLADGTLIWTSPTGQRYVTTPGSALLFPQLCSPTPDIVEPDTLKRRTERTAMMPQRRHSRAESHARYVTAQRRQNQKAREARSKALEAALPQPTIDDDPPPF